MENQVPKQKGFLATVERLGAKFPHPIVLFLWMTVIVLVLSFVLSKAGITAVHPSTGETIQVTNLLSREGARMFLVEFVDNFQAFPILGVVVVMGAITGLCEKTGLLTTVIRMSVSKLNGSAVVFLVAFLSVFSKLAGDVCQIIMPVLAAALFYGIGRHPLAGAFCAYAASSAGFAAPIIPGSGEVTLTPVVNSAAQIIDPTFNISALGSYYGLFVNGIIISIVTTLVTVKLIEPRLGRYTGVPDGVDPADSNIEVSEIQRTAAKKAGIAALIYIVVLVVLCIPSNSIFRNDATGSLINGSTLLASLTVLLGLLFLIPGMVYGRCTGQIKSVNDVARFMGEAVKDLSGFIVMAIVIGQFLRVFSDSQIGVLVGIKGGEALSSLNVPPQVIVVLFILLVASINILMASCMSKFLIMAPIFIPMLMQLNIHPAFTFWIYRIGDGITNLITPLDAVFVMLLATVQKYDKKANMGTLLTNLLPFSGAYFVVLCVVAVIWMTLGIDVGVGGHVFLS